MKTKPFLAGIGRSTGEAYRPPPGTISARLPSGASPERPDAARAGSGVTISGGMVRVVVKLRPDQYDALFRHVREVGSTMSAFCRESAVKAMREEHSDAAQSAAADDFLTGCLS